MLIRALGDLYYFAEEEKGHLKTLNPNKLMLHVKFKTKNGKK